MFVIRRANLEDQATLLKLAKMVHFINLPADNDIIAKKISASRQAFMRVARGEAAHIGDSAGENPGGLSEAIAKTDLYMFVLDDTNNPGCLGTSQLIAQMGGPHNPNLCFKLEIRHKYSESLKTGSNILVARLHEDATGPTEIGGLILQPSFRGHPDKLGRLLSLVRFHMIGRFRDRFRDEILAEMMAPITADGNNLLWDFLGRRFVPLSYEEADRFCQYSREFIKALFPTGDIHISLLPPQAREVIGRVGPETVPARKMLEKLGFKYHDQVDPFDGGPFLRASTDDVWVIKATENRPLGEPVAKSRVKQRAIVSVLQDDGEFRAVEQPIAVGKDGSIQLTREAMSALDGHPGMECGVTFMPVPTRAVGVKPVAQSSGSKSSSSKPAVGKATPGKSTSTKPASTKPAGSKPAGVKAASPKVHASKPAKQSGSENGVIKTSKKKQPSAVTSPMTGKSA